MSSFVQRTCVNSQFDFCIFVLLEGFIRYNHMIYYICAAVLLLMFVLFYLDRWNKTRGLSQDQTQQPEPDVPAGECCGKHVVCEKQKLAEARLRSAQYFDDEDLDRFKGRGSDGYSDQEVEEFRYVMYTMRQDEVREWMECLQAREIELPDELKEECYSMMNEV